MSVTKRFIIIVSSGLLLLVPFNELLISLTVFFGYNFLCLALLFTDYLISPKLTVFDIRRGDEDKLFFKADNTVNFSVRNNYRLPLELALKDEIPDFHFNITGRDMKKTIVPHSSEVYSYKVIPSKRGAFLFENIYLKMKSRLGLCYKYGKRKLPADFKVYPNLKDLSKYRLLLTKNMALENGKRIVNIKGEGLEFESMREYLAGDDFRKINWNVSARADKYVINLYEAEKNQPVIIMIDTGRPMSYILKGDKKLDYAINAALILSDIVNGKGDSSGLIVFDTEVRTFIKPGKGPFHRNTLMEALYHIKDTNKTSDFYGAFRELVSRQKRRSIVFVFTDFETEVELSDLTARVKILRKRHLPVVVLMKNDSVIKMSENTGRDSRTLYEKSVALEYLANRKQLIRALNLNGVICVESDAENFAIDAVNRYLEIKSGSLI
jgi:uncharacterized protein (DUF58 family)